jgi:hypothetical protein
MLRVLLLALALLGAQQSALAHDVWHGAGAAKSQQQDNLCKLHDALGTVAGALDALPAAAALIVVRDEALPFTAHSAPCLPLALPASRGPPALL